MRKPRGGPPDLVLQFPHENRASRIVRSALRPMFAVGDRLGADVTLGVSELVTNVVSYTHRGGELRVWMADPVRVEVHDHSNVLPIFGSNDGVGGRGLAIVAELTRGEWGVEVCGSTKYVWAEFAHPR